MASSGTIIWPRRVATEGKAEPSALAVQAGLPLHNTCQPKYRRWLKEPAKCTGQLTSSANAAALLPSSPSSISASRSDLHSCALPCAVLCRVQPSLLLHFTLRIVTNSLTATKTCRRIFYSLWFDSVASEMGFLTASSDFLSQLDMNSDQND